MKMETMTFYAADPTADLPLGSYSTNSCKELDLNLSEMRQLHHNLDFEPHEPELVKIMSRQPYGPITSPITPPATPEPESRPYFPSTHAITTNALRVLVNHGLHKATPPMVPTAPQDVPATVPQIPELPSVVRHESPVMRPMSIGFTIEYNSGIKGGPQHPEFVPIMPLPQSGTGISLQEMDNFITSSFGLPALPNTQNAGQQGYDLGNRWTSFTSTNSRTG